MSGTIMLAGQVAAEMARIYRDASDVDQPWVVEVAGDHHAEEPSSEISLLDQLPVGVAIYDRHGVLVHANPYFRRRVPSASLSSAWKDDAARWLGWTSSGDALAAEEFPCARALRGLPVKAGVDLLYKDPDGSRRWLNVSAAPIFAAGECTALGIIMVAIDSTEAASTSCPEASCDVHLKQFAEQSSSAIWIVDATTRRYRYRNPQHRSLISAEADARGLTRLADWIANIDEADRASAAQRYEAVLEGASEQHEYRLQAGSGDGPLCLRETTFPIKGDDGKIVGICGITERTTPMLADPVFLVGGAGVHSGPVSHQLTQVSGEPNERFGSIAAFVEASSHLPPGCVVVDLNQVPDAADSLIRMLADHAERLPIIVIGTPDTDAATAIAAMRAGAMDYLIAPYVTADLARALDCAKRRLRCLRSDPGPATNPCSRLEGLSHRELEVLAGLRAGGTNKSIGRDLGISPRTVESHRSKLMERMNVRNLAELLQAAQ